MFLKKINFSFYNIVNVICKNVRLLLWPQMFRCPKLIYLLTNRHLVMYHNYEVGFVLEILIPMLFS